MKAKKDFDCVAMKNEIQQRLYERRKNMTHAEELADVQASLASSCSHAAKWWRHVKKTAAPSDSLNTAKK